MFLRKARSALLEYRIILVLLPIVLIFGLGSPNFLTQENLVNVLRQVSVEGVVAAGMTMVIIGAQFDLSVGSILSLAGALVVGLQGYGIAPAMVAALVVGASAGLFNGFLSTRGKINSFIVTLASMVGVRGLVYTYAGEVPISNQDPFLASLGGDIGPAPFTVVVFVLVFLVIHLVLSRTRFGRNVYASGGNETAARLSGIDVDTTRMWTFIICGFLAGLAGVLQVGRMAVASPAAGRDTALNVITAVVLGGTALSGGFGSVWKTLAGALVIALLGNGMNLMNVFGYYQMAIKGAILVLVVVLDAYYLRRRRTVQLVRRSMGTNVPIHRSISVNG
jgi:ribose transport system permease protein